MEILLQKIVISYHLVGKAPPYNIDNKLDQLTQKIFNTTFVSTMHMVTISDRAPFWVN